jgi:hypothetical protein
LRPCCNRLVWQKMSCKFLIASTYNYIRNTCLWLLVLGCFIFIICNCPCLTDFMNYLIHATPVHPSLCLQYFILLFTIATITVFILLLLLLFHYYHHYKTVDIDKPLRASLFPCAAELTTHLLRLINILERCYTYDVSCTICVRRERCTVRCFRACADEAQHSRMSVRFLVVHMSYALCRTHSVFEYSSAPLVSNQ